MAKINYTKVEEALAHSLQKMNVQRLLQLADLAEKGEEEDQDSVTKEMLQILHAELNRMRKKDKPFYKQLGLAEEEVKKILDHPEELTEEDWKKIVQIREKIAEHAKELKKQLPPSQDDETYIERQRKEQKDKRYNIKDDWFPI